MATILNAVKFKDVNSFNKNKTKANVKNYFDEQKIVVFEDNGYISPNRSKVSHVFRVNDIDRIPTSEALIVLSDYKKGLDTIQKEGLSVKKHFPNLGIVSVNIPEHFSFEDTHKRVIAKDHIHAIEQNHIQVTHSHAVDFSYNDIWQLPALRCQEGWDLIPAGPDNYVAVFDVACQVSHPDLVGQTFDNRNHYTGTLDVEPTVNDSAASHGTACTGTICANPTNNIDTIGVAGPRTKVTFQAIGKSAGGGSFYTSPTVKVAAIEYVMQNPLCVAISMSYGCGQCSCPTISPTDIENAAFERARTYGRGGNFSTNTPGLGILCFASSGNDGTLNCGTLPANYPSVVSVGATTPDQTKALFSNYGTKLDFTAPGFRTPTTDRTGTDGYNLTWQNINYPSSDTCTPNGTSFSCPIAAGVAAAVAAANPTITASQILDIMKLTCNKIGPYNYNYSVSDPGKSLELGYGQVDLYAAVSLAVSGTIPPGPIVLPDLRVVVSSVASVNQGNDITLYYTLSLNTILSTDTTFDVKIFYSTDAIYDPSDPEITTVSATIPANTAYIQNNYTFTVPNTISGNIYFGVFADSTNVIDPEPELNNVGFVKVYVVAPVIPTGLNLAVDIDSISLNATGDKVIVGYNLHNTGADLVTHFTLLKGFDGLDQPTFHLFRNIESEKYLFITEEWNNIPDLANIFNVPFRIEILSVNGVIDDNPNDNVSVALTNISASIQVNP